MTYYVKINTYYNSMKKQAPLNGAMCYFLTPSCFIAMAITSGTRQSPLITRGACVHDAAGAN
jgi:hypothetical protein